MGQKQPQTVQLSFLISLQYITKNSEWAPGARMAPPRDEAEEFRLERHALDVTVSWHSWAFMTEFFKKASEIEKLACSLMSDVKPMAIVADVASYWRNRASNTATTALIAAKAVVK